MARGCAKNTRVMKITYQPIGVMHCTIKEAGQAPRFYNASTQPGTIEIYAPYREGLTGLERCTQVVVLFHFHRSEGYALLQRSRPEEELRGVFSLCSPMRPNAIGMSILRLVKVEPPLIYVENVDLIDETPILDIKPFKPPVDCNADELDS